MKTRCFSPGKAWSGVVAAILTSLAPYHAAANLPGGGTGTGANVTLTDNGTTVTLSNGIVSIPITKASANIYQINYTYNNGAGPKTMQLLSGGKDGGELYWELGGFGSGSFTYSVVADPSTNGGNYAEIALFSGSTSNGAVEIHFSMLRGSPGFYIAPIWMHRNGDVAMGTGEERDNIYIAPYFNWMSVDDHCDRQLPIGATQVPAAFSPQENALYINGFLQGTYEDKYKWCANFGTERVWGWSSVQDPVSPTTYPGQNIGIWHVLASSEFYNGGPLKPELMDAPMVNMTNGGHYEMGSDSNFAANEVWTRVSGPYFIYCNNVASSLTDPVQVSRALFADAKAQATAEGTAWPYSWFSNANYALAAARGTVTGKIIINDTFNPNASAANLWVGVVRQPSSTTNVNDFQQWMKPYQFWVKSDANGNFSIPNVIAGSNYTLFAFGPGAAETFQSQSLGAAATTVDIPATPFAVSVTGGATTALGNVTWTPTRVGPTVFEIGVPDRSSDEFRHGDDYFQGDVGPSPTAPSPVWTKFLEYPFDFPNGPHYQVGQSRWSTDWNFIQPIVIDSQGNMNGSTSTITFNLASAPPASAQPSLYIAQASNYYGPVIVQVNGTSIAGSTGYGPYYGISDTSIREGNHAAYADNRFSFASTLLKQGTNTITLNMRKGGYFANHAMYDYIRLELTGYVPPAPASVSAYAGVSRVLLSWPVTPGATSYNLLRSTTSGSGYASLASNIVGPVCGSGPNNATYVDTTAVNGMTYYYVVQSVNPVGASANSAQSSGVMPLSSAPAGVSAAPAGLANTIAPGSVTLTWTAATGANYYTVLRGTVITSGVNYVTPYVTLSNAVTGTSYTDTSPSNGTSYSYQVFASNAAGTSPGSTAVTAKPVAAALSGTTAPAVTGTDGAALVGLNWTAVPGAVGYVVQVGTVKGGPYTFLTSTSTLNYTQTGLANNTTYYYIVTANNSGGVSPASTEVGVTTAPAAPTNVNPLAGNTQVTLSWTAPAGATSYVVQRATVSGGPYTTVASGVPGPSFTDNGLINGTTYYYVVAASNGAVGVNSAEGSATPGTTVPVSPTSLTAAGGNTQVMLNWAASTGAASYTVRRAMNNGGPYVNVSTSVSGTTYTDTGLTNGTTYYYVVAATNAGGTGANSSQASAIPVLPPPAAPAGLTAMPGNAQVTLNWTAASGATGYTLKRGTASGQETVTVASGLTGTTYTNAINLTNGTTYYYVVTASNSGGASGNSNEASATPAQTFAQWIAAAFPGQSSPAVIGPGATPSGDAYPNLVEYFLGLAPGSGGAANVVTCSRDEQGRLLLNFRLAKNMTGVVYAIQQSTDLVQWSATGVTGTVVSDQGSYYQMQAVIPGGTDPALFVRLAVSSGG